MDNGWLSPKSMEGIWVTTMNRHRNGSQRAQSRQDLQIWPRRHGAELTRFKFSPSRRVCGRVKVNIWPNTSGGIRRTGDMTAASCPTYSCIGSRSAMRSSIAICSSWIRAFSVPTRAWLSEMIFRIAGISESDPIETNHLATQTQSCPHRLI